MNQQEGLVIPEMVVTTTTKKKRGVKKQEIAITPVKTVSVVEEKILTEQERFDLYVKNFLADNENRDNLTKWAKMFEERFRGNWFTFEKIAKKTPLKDMKEISTYIGFMLMLDLVHSKIENGVKSYKVTLDKKSKIRLLEIDLEDLSKKRDAIQTAIDRLKIESSLIK